MTTRSSVRVIACGALSHELAMVRRALGEACFEISCLPPELHNSPADIPSAVETVIVESQARGETVFVAYADCGTGGLLDTLLARYRVERLPGAHCYEFYAGSERFHQWADAEPGTFYLTDFLVWHFDRLVIHSLGIDRHPELIPEYFRHYTKVMYLRQSDSNEWCERAREIADLLGLQYEEQVTGLGDLASSVTQFLGRQPIRVVVEHLST